MLYNIYSSTLEKLTKEILVSLLCDTFNLNMMADEDLEDHILRVIEWTQVHQVK